MTARDRDVGRDARLESLESIVHAFGVVPSITALSSHHYTRYAGTCGPLTSGMERYALHIAHLVPALSSSISVHRELRLQGSPTALVSRIHYPNADRAFAHSYLSQLSELGTVQQRRFLLEGPVPASLDAALPDGFIVGPFGSRFHDTTSDIAVTGPDRQMFNIELRNRRTHIHDVLSPADRRMLTASHASRRTTLFVTPRATIRFRRDIAKLGGKAIDTQTYVVRNQKIRHLVTTNGWACWPPSTPDVAGPAVAHLIADALLSHYDKRQMRLAPIDDGAATRDVSTRDASREVRRLLRDHGYIRKPRNGPAARVAEALQLHKAGIPTQQQAAEMIGCASPTLSRDFKREGIASPWPWGGPRPKSGRKSS